MKVFTLQLALFLVPLLAILVTPTWPGLSSLHVSAQGAFEYYGYTPPSNFSALDADPRAYPYFRLGWEVDPVTGAYKQNYGYVDNGTCYLDIVGINDSTHVSIYDISGVEPVLLEAFTVNRMELHNTTIPAKTYFKVVSDRRVAVAVGGGGSYGGEVHAFYPSTDGGFAGKEFIFMAFPGTFDAYYGVGNMIYAVEKAKVTVYDDKGGVVLQKELKANETLTNLRLFHRRVYRVESTGRLIVAAWGATSFTAAPSIMGGYAGRYFFVNPRTISSWGTVDISAVIIVNQGAQSRVSVRETDKSPLATKDMAANSVWLLDETSASILGKNLIIESTRDILVFVTSTWRASPGLDKLTQGVAFTGVKPGEATTLPTFSKAVAFSPEANARVIIGTFELDIPRGGYAELPKGVITLTSNATLLVEMISQPLTYISQEVVGGGRELTFEVPALNNWAVYLASPDAVRAAYPPPVAESGMDIALIAGAAGAAAVMGAVVVWKKPWRRSSS